MTERKSYWHSAFTEQELRVFLSLVNRVYAGITLLPEDAAALADLMACVKETKWKRRLDQRFKKHPVLSLARAIGDAINDPVWRRCLAEMKAAVQASACCDGWAK